MNIGINLASHPFRRDRPVIAAIRESSAALSSPPGLLGDLQGIADRS